MASYKLDSVHPGATVIVSLSAHSTVFNKERLMTMPPSLHEKPSIQWPPLFTATGKLFCLAYCMASTTPAVFLHNAITKGNLSIRLLKPFRKVSYSGVPFL